MKLEKKLEWLEEEIKERKVVEKDAKAVGFKLIATTKARKILEQIKLDLEFAEKKLANLSKIVQKVNKLKKGEVNEEILTPKVKNIVYELNNNSDFASTGRLENYLKKEFRQFIKEVSKE